MDILGMNEAGKGNKSSTTKLKMSKVGGSEGGAPSWEWEKHGRCASLSSLFGSQKAHKCGENCFLVRAKVYKVYRRLRFLAAQLGKKPSRQSGALPC